MIKAIVPNVCFYGGTAVYIHVLFYFLELDFQNNWDDWKFSLIATPITLAWFVFIAWLVGKTWEWASK